MVRLKRVGMATVVINNRYRVQRELGQGGFGKTFLAVDTHLPSERPCVIKQLYPIIAKPKEYEWIRERFQREAAILEALSRGSNQIPQLYAYFAEGETFYLVQEYIEGVTLTEKVEQTGCLSEKEVTRILTSLLHVLDYVHQQRIIHRDIKPDNVILRASDNEPVLIDFGVVKEALGTAMDSQHTHSMAIGTPGYMPSEQAAGRPTFSSDLYSLGLTAVFLLSGQPPHLLESDSNSGELLWRKVVPQLHSQLAGVIDQAIRFHPRDRFPDAQAMLAALQGNRSVSQPTTNQQSNSQPRLTEQATVAAAPQHEYEQQQIEEPSKKSNSLWVGLIIFLILLGSGGVIGYGAIQLLDLLRSGRDRVVREDSQTDKQSQNSEASQQQDSSQENNRREQIEREGESGSESKDSETEDSQNQQQEEAENSDKPPVVVVPSTESKPEKQIEEVPIFSTGVKQQKVVDALGEPTKRQSGYWKNTQALTYQDYVPGKLDLGYVFDRETKQLLQTEASFHSSVELSTIETTLKQMLKGQMNSQIKEALAEVYRNETDLRSFAIGQWQAIIQRKSQDRIYISVWDDDLP